MLQRSTKVNNVALDLEFTSKGKSLIHRTGLWKDFQKRRTNWDLTVLSLKSENSKIFPFSLTFGRIRPFETYVLRCPSSYHCTQQAASWWWDANASMDTAKFWTSTPATPSNISINRHLDLFGSYINTDPSPVYQDPRKCFSTNQGTSAFLQVDLPGILPHNPWKTSRWCRSSGISHFGSHQEW